VLFHAQFLPVPASSNFQTVAIILFFAMLCLPSMTEQQKQKLLDAFIELEAYIREYRKAILWLTQGNNTTFPPNEDYTRQIISELTEQITERLAAI
jgi:hypothetical protein